MLWPLRLVTPDGNNGALVPRFYFDVERAVVSHCGPAKAGNAANSSKYRKGTCEGWTQCSGHGSNEGGNHAQTHERDRAPFFNYR